MTVMIQQPSAAIRHILAGDSVGGLMYLTASDWIKANYREEDETAIDYTTERWHYFRTHDEIFRVKEEVVMINGREYRRPNLTNHTVSCEVVDDATYLVERVTVEMMRQLIDLADRRVLKILWGE